jgi:hypothetical protein
MEENDTRSHHGLTWDGTKRRWKLRITIDRGRKIVGKRIQLHLPGTRRENAIAIRETVIEAIELLGVKVNVKPQNRQHLGRHARG